MKKVGIVFLGFVTIVVIYILLGLAGEKFSPDYEFGSSSVFLGVLIVMPIIFLIGSFVTGYFSYYEVKSKWGLIWLAPILYFNLLVICVTFVGFLLDSFVGVYEPSGAGFLSCFFLF